ncbi:universal stress protein [Streptomyces sp. NPDC007875]|uniref:universal stress protein n=1 Tax=Streptomyces sp. NPDC007875 TaxID=3364783 RepID=UPI00369DE6F2
MEAGIPEDIAVGARRELDEVLRSWREKLPRMDVRDEVRLESPAMAVVRAAADRDLLMAGGRKRPPALGPRLGPVAQAAVHHAPCPVAVVPHE